MTTRSKHTRSNKTPDQNKRTTNISLLMSPVADIASIIAAWQNYQNLKTKLLDLHDYQDIAGKKYIKKSGWRKIQTAFGISDDVTKEERKETDNAFYYEVTVRVSSQNGRFSHGMGSCCSKERHFIHPEHDVRATAHTRAKNRAISDLVGFGEVSAEEMGTENSIRDTQDVITDESISGAHTESVSHIPSGPQIADSDPITERQRKLLSRLIHDRQGVGMSQEVLQTIGAMNKVEANLMIRRYLTN